MPSMQEALTDALEHPLAEPRRPQRKSHKAAPKSEGPSALWYGVFGSIVGSLVVFGLYRGISKILG